MPKNVLGRLQQLCVDRYLSIDPRSLGLFRVVLALVLLLDLARRAAVLPHFYTNAGLVPNHMILWSPARPRIFSFLFMASHQGEAVLCFVLIALVFMCLLLGFRTKLVQVLSLLCVVSLNSRITIGENGGDMALNSLCIWTLFLPLGRRFSLDALFASLAARQEREPSHLEHSGARRVEERPVVSLAVLAVLLQVSAVYFFNVVHKSGSTWMDGTAVHYTLHQDRIATWFGVWLRERLTLQGSQALTYATLAIEALAPILILSPFYTEWTRRSAIVLLTVMHLGFALCVDVGIFSFSMLAYYPLLVSRADWQWLKSAMQRLGRERVVYFDASCGLCFQTARLLVRMDRLRLLQLLPNDRLPLSEQAAREVTERSIVVQGKGGRWLTRSRAVSELMTALPLGSLAAWPLKMPLVRELADWAYDRVARNRRGISVWFGWAACGLPSSSEPRLAAREPSQPASLRPASQYLHRAGRWTSEALVLLWLVVAFGELQQANHVPGWMRYRQPDFFQMLVDYPRAYQPWAMFAPEAPKKDMTIVVDAVTQDGRHVDPYNEVASRVPVRVDAVVPDRLGQGQFWTGYSLFIPRKDYRSYYGGLDGWIRSYHERTGKPGDRIVRYKVYELWDTSPLPGETAPHSPKATVFASSER